MNNLTPAQKNALHTWHLKRRQVFQTFEPQMADLQQKMLAALLAVDGEFYRQHPHLNGHAANGQESTPELQAESIPAS